MPSIDSERRNLETKRDLQRFKTRYHLLGLQRRQASIDPGLSIEGRVFELVNELALVRLSCKYTIFNSEIKQLITTVNPPSSHSKKNK